LVNPLILEDLVQAGYDRPFEQLQGGLPIDPGRLTHDAYRLMHDTVDLPALRSAIVDDLTLTVCLLPGTGLDFGGVAKGWAAHQAVQRLGATAPALVSAGGDVAVSGPRADGEPWRINVEDPFRDDGYLEMLYIESGGVATSGKDHRHWQRGGLFQHHIIDPRTRQPALTDILAATVVASSVMRAEALAKAVLISGSRAGLELLDDQADAEGMLVLDDGRILYSPNFEMYL
jgi:thiamine biosynthesis lipoprotein